MAQINDTENPTSQTQPQCYLTSVPGEIRNKIYECFLAANIEQEEENDLLTARLPSDLASKAILLTCKGICKELGSLFKEICRRFWTNGKFIARTDYRDEDKQRLSVDLHHASAANDVLDQRAIASLANVTCERRRINQGKVTRVTSWNLNDRTWNCFAGDLYDHRPLKWEVVLLETPCEALEELYNVHPMQWEDLGRNCLEFPVGRNARGLQIVREVLRGTTLTKSELKVAAAPWRNHVLAPRIS